MTLGGFDYGGAVVLFGAQSAVSGNVGVGVGGSNVALFGAVGGEQGVGVGGPDVVGGNVAGKPGGACFGPGIGGAHEFTPAGVSARVSQSIALIAWYLSSPSINARRRVNCAAVAGRGATRQGPGQKSAPLYDSR